ncbi:MAG: lamin tail domain-containing protein [Verrucomicrobiota bacterium]
MMPIRSLTVFLGFVLPLMASRSSGQDMSSLVTHWRLDEPSGNTVRDARGSSRELPDGYNYGRILNDEFPDWQPAGGISRGAYHFDGAASVLMEGYAGATRSLSLAMWIRPSSWQDSVLAHKVEEGHSGKGWSLILTADGAVEFRIGSVGNFTAARAVQAYTPGQWTHLTAVYEGPGKKEKFRSRATVAVNGMVSAVACEILQSPGAGTARLILGTPPVPADGVPSGFPFSRYTGDLDRFLIWSQGLKRKDMAALVDFNDPTNIRVRQMEPGNFLDWVLVGQDPDPEDDFDFVLLPDPSGAERGGAVIKAGILSFESLPAPGKSFYLTIRGNDGTGRSLVKNFIFTTPVKSTGGGGGGGGGGNDGPKWPGGGGGDGDNDGDNGNPDWPGTEDGDTVTLPREGSPAYVTTPILTQQWTPLDVPAGAELGRLASQLIQLETRPAAVRNLTLVAGAGDADNALFSLTPETVPGNPQTSALRAAGPLELHDGRAFRIRVRASAPIGGSTVSTEIALVFSAVRPHLNEFLADNEFGMEDEDGETSDWIEIHNPAPHPLRLDNWRLTNDPGRPDLWRAPARVLQAGGFHCFFASKKGGGTPENASRRRPNHTGFTLKKEEGEYLGLHAPDGGTAASEYTFLPAQKSDDSYGCYLNDPATRGPMAAMTPNAHNGRPPVPRTGPVTAVPGHGFYAADVPVTLSCGSSGALIYFTVDGSVPTAVNGQLYTTPLTLTGNTSLRARAFAPGSNPSDLLTANYIFPHTIQSQPAMGPGDSAAVAAAIRALPALTITMAPEDLAKLGNAPEADAARDAELEWLPAPGTAAGGVEFQQVAAIRVSGQSRVGVSPKTAFRLSFTDWLKAPIFGDQRAGQFKELALRTPFQNSWLSPEPAERPRGQEIRDEFVRRLHGRMGNLSPVGNFVHLFLNGQYYGLFNPAEVPGDLWQFSYGGCSDDDFDTMKEGEVQDDESLRTGEDWTAVSDFATDQPVTAADYLNIIGGGIDLDSLIDLILLSAYTGDEGLELWSGTDMEGQHNWFAGREWVNKKPFRFFVWDAESTLGEENFNAFTGPKHSTLFEKLITHVDFRARVIARVQRHFYDGGALAGNAPRDLYASLAAEIEPAIPAEAARWGDKNPEGGRYGLTDWRKERDRLLGTWFPARRDAVLAQLTALGLNVRLTPPVLSPAPGWLPAGTPVKAASEAGTLIYYTAEPGGGPPTADPRSAGGSVSLQARLWVDPIVFPENTVLTLRAWSGGVWSAPFHAAYRIGPQRPSHLNFTVSEIMYNGAEAGKANFLEFHNPSGDQVDITGLVLSDGVRFTGGGEPRVLEPGAYGLLVESRNSFIRTYGEGLPVWAEWSGALSLEGESVTVIFPESEFGGGLSFSYSPGPGWPRAAAVKPFSLVPREPGVWIGEDEPGAWRASFASLGSPGAADLPVPAHAPVVINEIVLTGDLAKVELLNLGTTPGDVSGWILSPPDSSRTPGYRIELPPNTVIPGSGYLVVEGPAALFRNYPRMDLTAVSAAGAPIGYVDSLTLYPVADGVSLGPFTARDGSQDTAPLAAPTPGSANLWPRVPQLVISEIMYHPDDGDVAESGGVEVEWIEILNRGDVPVNLDGIQLPLWSFTFPASSLPPHGFALVISSQGRDAFREQWKVPASVPIFTAQGQTLANSGPFIVLAKTGSDPAASGYTEWVAVSDQAPWPDSADGEGRSLERYETGAFANDSAAWRASYQHGGSPGRVRAASFENWRRIHFSADELLRGILTLSGADPDHDDLINLGEYAFGGDPRKARPPAAVSLKTTTPAGGVEITFPRRAPGLSSASCDIQVSNGLGGWRTVTSRCAVIRRIPLPDGLEETTLRYTGPETALPRCFLRVLTRLTPP